jgi:hypothetical protein
LGPRIKTAGPILESASNVKRMKREGTVEPVDRFRRGIPNPESAEVVVDSLPGSAGFQIKGAVDG